MKKYVFLFLFCLLLPFSKCFGLAFENDQLILKVETRKNDKATDVLADFTLKDGWHISYQNPGDAGVPTAFYFDGLKTEPLYTSVPEKFLYDELITQYGYGAKAYYIFNLSDKTESLKMKVNWTVCKDYCEPQEVVFDVENKTSSGFESTYKKALKTFPLKLEENLFAQIKNGKLIFSKKNLPENVLYFIADKAGIISADANQILTSKKTFEIDAPDLRTVPDHGLLVTKDKAYDVIIEAAKPNIFFLLMLAFIGGIILNLMPCVFPVLSLKALQMAGDIKLEKGRFLRGTLYVLGVVLSFLIIAGVLFLFKAGGAALGWGFQLQSPIFVLAMIVLFVFILLYLFGILNVTFPFLTKMAHISSLNSFLTGFLAVLIASPCTGPFMGAAVGYALFETPNVYFPMFLALGLGYALPFALLEFFPFVMRQIMPKPGKWMVRLKYILSVPIILTIMWLSWVFYHEVRPTVKDDLWAPYSNQTLEKALDNGDAVFIDFTAKWCLTCLLNERAVLDDEKFLKLAQEKGIKLLKADWTNKDDAVFEALKKYGRSSVPLYVFYHQDSEDYIILPQILTDDIVQNVLEGE